MSLASAGTSTTGTVNTGTDTTGNTNAYSSSVSKYSTPPPSTGGILINTARDLKVNATCEIIYHLTNYIAAQTTGVNAEDLPVAKSDLCLTQLDQLPLLLYAHFLLGQAWILRSEVKSQGVQATPHDNNTQQFIKNIHRKFDSIEFPFDISNI